MLSGHRCGAGNDLSGLSSELLSRPVLSSGAGWDSWQPSDVSHPVEPAWVIKKSPWVMQQGYQSHAPATFELVSFFFLFQVQQAQFTHWLTP